MTGIPPQRRAEVRYPSSRLKVVHAVTSLSDRAHQERVWIQHRYPRPGYYDDFDLAVHILFDDMAVLPDPELTVGVYLHPDEVAPLRALGQILGPLINDLGDISDAGYLAHPRWPEVVAAAKEARQVMEANEGR